MAAGAGSRSGQPERAEAMSGTSRRAIEEAADKLGELLLESAEGAAAYSYEDLAEATLAAGLEVTCERGPDAARVAAVAEAIHAALHPREGAAWAALDAHAREFWFDIARAAIAVSDRALLDEAAGRAGDAAGTA